MVVVVVVVVPAEVIAVRSIVVARTTFHCDSMIGSRQCSVRESDDQITCSHCIGSKEWDSIPPAEGDDAATE